MEEVIGNDERPYLQVDALRWRYIVLLAVLAGSIVILSVIDPIPQWPEYHAFADTRAFLGMPNAVDVLSNLPLAIIGLTGVLHILRTGAGLGHLRSAWIAVFAGASLAAMGSAYYHLSPSDGTLVWDRLPMSVAFMGFLVALLGEHVWEPLAPRLLAPALLLGFASVVYWRLTDDLRPYVWVQAMPLLLVPVVLLLFKSRYTHHWLLLAALGWYALAKIGELYDARVFHATGDLISGHSLKHLLAAAGCACLLVMLRRRRMKAEAPLPLPRQAL